MVMERVKLRGTEVLTLILLANMLIGYAYGQTNLVPNPSLEAGGASPDNWNASGAGCYWSNKGHSGIHSLGLNQVNASGDWSCNQFNVNGNQEYMFSFWVNGTYQGGEFYVYLKWFDVAHNWISQINYRIWGSYSEWINVNDTVTAPSNAIFGTVVFRGEPSGSGAWGDIQTDDFSLTPIIKEDPLPVQWFHEFFYGSAKWLTLIVTLAIVIAVSTVFPYGGILFLPITIFLGIDYFNNIPSSSDFMWGALMMLFASIYVLMMAIRKAKS
jgi:hypothetical protein